MPGTFVDKVPLNIAEKSAFLPPNTALLTASERVFRRDRWYLDNLPLPCFCPTGCADAARIPLCITTVVDVCWLVSAYEGGWTCFFFFFPNHGHNGPPRPWDPPPGSTSKESATQRYGNAEQDGLKTFLQMVVEVKTLHFNTIWVTIKIK